jgi:hypothetical protein
VKSIWKLSALKICEAGYDRNKQRGPDNGAGALGAASDPKRQAYEPPAGGERPISADTV